MGKNPERESMSNQPVYRWLDQQGEAFGSPGSEPRWTSSRKDTVGTAYSASSRIWFTCSHGILNEIYHPTIDRAQVRDMEFLITDGESFAHEEKRDLVSSFEYVHEETLGVRYVNRDPEGGYALIKEIICDPHRSVVLQHVRIEAPTDLLRRLKVYALLAPHLDGGGQDNFARAVDFAGHKALLAWKNDWSLAMGVSGGFSRVGCGFVGASDGWRDLMDNFKMDWEFGAASGGNVAVIGEIKLRADLGPCPGADTAPGSAQFTLAIGIGRGHHTAAQQTMSSLTTPFEDLRKRYIEQWQRAANPEWLGVHAQDGGKLMRVSHNLLLAHEDKTYSGAFVASASIPWGQSRGDDDMGGYHLVWTRDMVQTATALIACGRVESARRALVYLACTQMPDGGFAQNFWIDGSPYWRGKQLDEVGFPIILAWRLWKANGLGILDIYTFVERAAGCLLQQGPITPQERWEENAGYSPSTLAAVITALICAADIMRAHESHEFATFLEEFADWIEGHVEDWTVTSNGVLHSDVKRHYMRIRPPERGEAYAHEDCGQETLHLANRPPDTRNEFEAREIIDAGFLELVRYGVRRADDPLVKDSLKVVDSVIKRDLPPGPGWLRYNWDGYGERPDGGPFEGWGHGRVWPLLTGERAHYELAAGHDIAPLIATYENYASIGQMMAEQVWDEADRPERGLLLGRPTGSAVPLVWAHAEYLKLLRSALDGKVFDRVEAVYERYSEPVGRKRVRHDLEIYTRHRPIQTMDAGKTLRILDGQEFEVVWTDNGWQSTQAADCRALGCAGYSADIKPTNGSSEIEWTIYWPHQDVWLGHNVMVKIEAA
jgi:glucoamylase